ncbi:MAG: hypothetical protein AB8B91_02035 [Rubripirellula sp.]
MKLHQLVSILTTISCLIFATGCALVPETRHRERIHNPFPQLKRVAVLPFFNQSSEPTVDGEMVAEKYYAALQAIPGFEVLPVGVSKAQWMKYTLTYGEPRNGADFQRLAQQMGVEALVVGSITDFDAYYPPRMALTAHWYAANTGFHNIPAGYGLPWGTDSEKQIPKRIAREAEFELAREQLATQTPLAAPPAPIEVSQQRATRKLAPVAGQIVLNSPDNSISPMDVFEDGPTQVLSDGTVLVPMEEHVFETDVVGDFVGPDPALPANWPNPTDLIPDPPSPHRPTATLNHEPVLTHTRLYRGDDPYFTNRLADFVETGDDARPEGWQGYLKRSDDFVHFCCHLHITEMLESRGGREQSDLILRWPLSRY